MIRIVPLALAATLALTACLPSSPAQAQRCPVANGALEDALRRAGADGVLRTTREDADSHEPILRHVADFPGGATVVVEQQNCRIYNLRATLLSPRATPDAADLRAIGQALAATPLWRRYLSGIDPVALLTRELAAPALREKAAAGAPFSQPVDDELGAIGERSEGMISFAPSASDTDSYRSTLSLYVGIGGAE